jgi:hypothetical protein
MLLDVWCLPLRGLKMHALVACMPPLQCLPTVPPPLLTAAKARHGAHSIHAKEKQL